MSPVKLTSEQWIERHRQGLAAIVRGQRRAVLREKATQAPACVDIELVEEDPRSALIDGRLDAEDLSRVMTGFRGQPIALTPTMRYVRAPDAGDATAYVFDEDSGMVYILD